MGMECARENCDHGSPDGLLDVDPLDGLLD
jgi:hypothetical protein